jgi:hypothetical protein
MLQDVTGLKPPFAVMAGAPTNSLFVAANGKLGVGTDTPGLQMSLKNGDTPAVRMEQDSSSGFSPQTWDIGANEANWFVRDVTGGSRLPLRIRPGAPTSAVDIAASGNVGFGTASPGFRLDAAGATAVGDPVARLANAGPSLMRFQNTTNTGGNLWDVGNAADKTFTFTPDSGAPVLTLTPGGDATSTGVLQQNADPAATENRSDVDAADVLSKLRALSVKRSEVTADPANALHLGPTGADFRAAFGLGSSDGVIAPGDLASVSLVGLQALANRVDALDTSKVGTLGTRVDTLESSVSALAPTHAQIVQLVNFGQAADKRLKTLEKSNKSLLRRTTSLEKKVKRLLAKKS